MISWVIFAVVAACVLLCCKFGKSIGHVPDFRKSFSVMGLIIYTIIMLVCCSCATSKNTDTQKQVDYSNDLLNIQRSIESLRYDFTKQTKVTTDKLSNLKVENKTVYLSEPDSTGKQHTVKESTTIASKDEQERQEVDEAIVSRMEQFSTRMDSLSDKLDVLLNERTKVVELSWWDLHKDKVYCGIIFLLIVGLLVYRIQK